MYRLPSFVRPAAIAACFAMLCYPVNAQSVVVPGANTTTEGNTGGNSFPFSIAFYPASSMRYQQVYGSGGFTGLGPITINAIAFRPGSSGTAFGPTTMNVQIDLSTTTAAVDGLNTTFATNQGADNMTVYNGNLTLSSANAGPRPKFFDIVINLQNPFTYNPLAGNLLLDVRQFNRVSTTYFDAPTNPTDEISRLYQFNVNDPTGIQDTDGLVTQFRYKTSTSGIPEPGSFLLLGLALPVYGLVKERKRDIKGVFAHRTRKV